MSPPNRSQWDVDTDTIELSEKTGPRLQRVAASSYGMVATAHWAATEAGVEILSDGGNAMDAAIAAAFALGVCEPAGSGLGGQSFLLIHFGESRQTLAMDGSSRAPNRASAEEFLNKTRSRRVGHSATTVPSTPSTLEYVRQQHGTLPLHRLLEPAIRIAEEGYPVSRLQNALTHRELKKLQHNSARWFFLKDQKRPYPVGTKFRQPVLAETLRRLAKHGIEDFYRGEIARQIADDMAKNHGLIGLDDLAQIPWPTERRPLSCRFHNHRILTFPPPGAGPTLVEMFHIFERVPEKYRNPDTPRGAVILAEVIQQAFLDRRDRPTDPTYFQQIGDEDLLSNEYAQQIATQLRKKVKYRGWKPGHGETTHLSVMDRAGNVVGLTQSIERVYGSFAASPELGFLYNNYMSAFVLDDIAHPYQLRPNAVPWASVAPTIVFRGRRPWLVIGSPGSERITSSIVQVLLRLENGQSPYDAIAAPRLHSALDRTVSLEIARMRSDIPEWLQKHGFTIREVDDYSFYLGCVQMVMRDRDTLMGVADPRRDGSAGGPTS